MTVPPACMSLSSSPFYSGCERYCYLPSCAQRKEGRRSCKQMRCWSCASVWLSVVRSHLTPRRVIALTTPPIFSYHAVNMLEFIIVTCLNILVVVYTMSLHYTVG